MPIFCKCKHPMDRVKNLINKTEAKIKQSGKTKNLRKRTLVKLMLKKLRIRLNQRMHKSREGEIWSEQSGNFDDSLSEILEMSSSDIQEYENSESETIRQSKEKSKKTTAFKRRLSQYSKLKIIFFSYNLIFFYIFLTVLCAFIGILASR